MVHGKERQIIDEQCHTLYSTCHKPHLDAVDGYGRSVSEVRHERDLPPASDVHGIQPSRNLELLPR